MIGARVTSLRNQKPTHPLHLPKRECIIYRSTYSSSAPRRASQSPAASCRAPGRILTLERGQRHGDASAHHDQSGRACALHYELATRTILASPVPKQGKQPGRIALRAHPPHGSPAGDAPTSSTSLRHRIRCCGVAIFVPSLKFPSQLPLRASHWLRTS